MLRISTLLFTLLFTANGFAGNEKVFITIDNDAVVGSQKSFGQKIKFIDSVDGISLLEIDESIIPELSEQMHHDHLRCGGFMRFDNQDNALKELRNSSNRSFAKSMPFADYSITEEDTVRPTLERVSEQNILNVIEKLSSYRNRYYKSETGVNSSLWIKSHWESLVAGRSDAKVELFEHRKWAQPSIILTIKGESDEVIVVGGHADSISGYWGREKSRAPGADDNASGIATITEIIKVLVDSNFKPKKTIKFMAYAAEEVGLLGSKEIARAFKKQGENVIGVMQLDMTNFNGSDLDIVMMTDFTNKNQNAFIGRLLDKYIPTIKWGYDKCGYGCSDHASWHGQGYPASMPFEAKMKEMNRNIHTSRDTLKISRNMTVHAAKFARLGLSFVIELDR